MCALRPHLAAGVEAEAELLSAIVTFFQRLGLGPGDVGLKVSSRKVLQASGQLECGWPSCCGTALLGLLGTLRRAAAACALSRQRAPQAREWGMPRQFGLALNRCQRGRGWCIAPPRSTPRASPARPVSIFHHCPLLCRRCWRGTACLRLHLAPCAWWWTKWRRSLARRWVGRPAGWLNGLYCALLVVSGGGLQVPRKKVGGLLAWRTGCSSLCACCHDRQEGLACCVCSAASVFRLAQ